MKPELETFFPPFKVTAPMPTGTAVPPVFVAEERSVSVRPDQWIGTGWVHIDVCQLGSRVRMAPEAVHQKFSRLLCLGENAPWPPIVGHWLDERFVIDDGRHEYLASLMLGRERLFVCWLETMP